MTVLILNAIMRGFSIIISVGKVIYTTDDDIRIALFLYRRSSAAINLDAGKLQLLYIDSVYYKYLKI